ncbi:adaptor protein [Alkalihalobacillus alcalophilus ATCC 27647 = CGMCC 1.3604]|uniref:Adapter protein MecA n=1 Tax=Alkalihalobacillus alcalophilus ATCC 27647 = CGMCC 1.3604 TaxID=1218173 RepID=A0A094WKG0_ALKAL|nr:adaptor protein MecA [Alkalihalobacillus alcalophilus]KGA97326.1 adapter protein MecA [Alkalihalobacillus alcalophilus ATCC 27647 = CGMCC 1.3604]MED1561253.1 adaptor protein MecA [Alkalihalobacillus alcalophilus]THG90051.1 adaptor protein [Alkalihalobacillus alcalophilus ATCC 27647 = CGMCC 1.3604]
MDIERVNDSTIKFFITYNDMEDRGFDRDEIWYNRERGEELFFEMMNEVNERDEFVLDGPLWIQVHALDKGLEIVVTRGQVSDGHVKLEIPVTQEELDDDDLIDDGKQVLEMDEPEFIELMIGFSDIEDVISLSQSFNNEEVENDLYFFEGTYYLHTIFHYERFSEDEQDDMLSQMLEFGYESDISIYRVKEYGKEIMTKQALKQLRETFLSK